MKEPKDAPASAMHSPRAVRWLPRLFGWLFLLYALGWALWVSW